MMEAAFGLLFAGAYVGFFAWRISVKASRKGDHAEELIKQDDRVIAHEEFRQAITLYNISSAMWWVAGGLFGGGGLAAILSVLWKGAP